jgi:flagellar motor component MotA
MTPTIEDRFREFHENNPQVYTSLVELAQEARERGVRRLGIELLWARLRWHYLVEVEQGNEPFKLNDHFTSRYARLIIDNEADLADLFEIRKLRTA